ncbi:hypothetical protein [Halalkalibacter urbisdiaboli]|uniref:hypothetical protein n=1 Tax=Halalkalibacter urbisdiaboli TaxID=1960589 RepID=UPI000B446BC0|nr:hypothetical protein [Halalkalibacter urbisdiaboli]
MKLEQYAKVYQGLVLSRFQTMPGTDAVAFSLYTMKEMSDSLGFEYHGSTEKLKETHISKEKANELPITKKGMVLINLTSHRAVSVRLEHEGLLVPSNFAVIVPDERLDALYLEWYINEHPSCRKQLRLATQGAVIGSLSIQMLRGLSIESPSLQQQYTMRNVYMSVQKKKKLLNERVELEEKLAKHLLLQSLKEEIK